MTALGTRLRTARALGLGNVATVIAYRMRLRAGLHPAQRLGNPGMPAGEFYGPATRSLQLRAPGAWQSAANYFGWYRPPLGSGPPAWHRNPFTGADAARASDPWWTIPDFDPAIGDIKTIWEASRFDWAVNMAQRAATGDAGELERLNRWIADWAAHNPAYRGHNWKCAQETSIRVLHLATAWLMLGGAESPSPALRDLLMIHLRRIVPTLAYARAQDNNHGTSEAAALFVGGSWLERAGVREAARWTATGRALVRDRVERLVLRDGTFSQYSATYHRLFLDTISLAEVWRRRFDLPPFDGALVQRAAAATEWLRAVVDPVTGDAPNLGGNDSANLLPFSDGDGRDFRASVQLACALFAGRRAYAGRGSWDAATQWLDVDANLPPAGEAPTQFDEGGFAMLRRDSVMALLRYPRLRFRPAHADLLHLDFWIDGQNVLRDAGSYSYAADVETQDRFAGVRGHNAVQFDNHDQMPRLGRFLWGAWPETLARSGPSTSEGVVSASASFRDAWGALHGREVRLAPHRLEVVDRIADFQRRAVLRWRLRPGRWTLDGTGVSDGDHQLRVTADVPVVRAELVQGWESRFYLQRTEAPMLEIEVAQPGTLRSVYAWPS